MQPSHGPKTDRQREKRFLEKLRSHPELLERFEAILELTEGPHRTADQVEELLVEEVRRLGNKTMQQWAQRVEEHWAEDLREKTPGLEQQKKST